MVFFLPMSSSGELIMAHLGSGAKMRTILTIWFPHLLTAMSSRLFLVLAPRRLLSPLCFSQSRVTTASQAISAT